MTPLIIGVVGPVVTLAVCVVGYFAARRVQTALASKTNAEAKRTDAETDKTRAEARQIDNALWQSLAGEYVADNERLRSEVAGLRDAVAAAERRAEAAEDEARQCRIELSAVTRRLDHPQEDA